LSVFNESKKYANGNTEYFYPKRNAPNEIPIAILCRLAVEINHSGKGLGETMLVNAIERIENVSVQINRAN